MAKEEIKELLQFYLDDCENKHGSWPNCDVVEMREKFRDLVKSYLGVLNEEQPSLPEGLWSKDDDNCLHDIKHYISEINDIATSEEVKTRVGTLLLWLDLLRIRIVARNGATKLPEGLEDTIQDWTKRVKNDMKNPQYQIEDIVRDCVKAGALCKVKRTTLLPQCLDEAAEKYRRDSCIRAMRPNIDGPAPEYGGSVNDTFKAGAKWMAGQGVSIQSRFHKARLRGYISFPILLEDGKDFNNGEEVIVQIRKAESVKKDWHEENASHGAFALTQDEIDFYYKK